MVKVADFGLARDIYKDDTYIKVSPVGQVILFSLIETYIAFIECTFFNFDIEKFKLEPFLQFGAYFRQQQSYCNCLVHKVIRGLQENKFSADISL